MEPADATLWALLGSLASAVIGGITWLCTKKCRNQSCEINSGCCRFHSDSQLRATIREEISKSSHTIPVSSQPAEMSAVGLQSV